MATRSPLRRARASMLLLRRRTLVAPVLLATLGLVLATAPGALAAPVNDDFADATPAVPPFSDVVDTTDATIETGEPQFCGPTDNSVWFAITPSADAILSADTSGSPVPGQVIVYRQDGTGLSGLQFLSCENFGTQGAVFDVEAGSTYYVQASTLFSGSAQLRVHIKELTAPANDDFADATPITAVPYDDTPQLAAASAQPGEPSSCVGSGRNTVWYAFTPSETNSYTVQRSGYAPLGVYTGGSLASLQQIACASWSTAVFHAEAGRTYYLQLAADPVYPGPQTLSVRVAPPATASFFYYPSDPSAFDTVQFYDNSYDIAEIASRRWGFGDGATATSCCPAHRYGADGDYTATLAITTSDGRSASAAQTVAVRTHDVWIAKMTVPNAARVGQQRRLSVEVSNARYDETVEVTLLRSVPGSGFEDVGRVTQRVPARARGRTTTFAVSYTFAADDATAGKVTFKAVAAIVGAREALPADNDITALPTKVSR